MSASLPLERERLACWPIGQLEYVVECLRKGEVEKWFVLRPHRRQPSNERTDGVALPHGCRIVVDAQSLKTLGILASDIPPPTPTSAGYNPYFDVPPT